MDERHWWIAGKIQESFHIGGYDNPTLLEDFMCESETLDTINQFLSAGGLTRLFFYCDRPASASLSTRELHMTRSLATLKDSNLDALTVLYFLRRNVDVEDIDASRMEKDVFCGELKQNTLENLNAMLSDIFIPLMKSQKEWGKTNEDSQTQLTHSMEKFMTSLSESATSVQASKQLMLRQPEHLISNDFKQHRLAALDQGIITEYEDLVTDWMSTIEGILTDTSDERFMDPNAGPHSELDRWRRRQRLLTSITEQLKGKECKAVIGVLITAKSRLLKKWKTIDAGITDAMNETKDKVKYLESLKRHIDQLYNGATPHTIINTALSGLMNTIKQMDSISRFYARGGFLGLFFTKVTNQIVLACKDYIKDCTINPDEVDSLWDLVNSEVEGRDLSQGTDPHHRLLRREVESRLKGSRAKTRETKEEDNLYGRLKACLTLQNSYRDSLRSLRDALGVSHNLSHFPSISSLGGPPGSFTARSKLAPQKGSRLTPGPPSKRSSSIAGDQDGHGVPIGDEDAILGHMDSFCSRIRQIIDVINTLSQYHRMVKSTDGLPRPRSEDLAYDGDLDGNEDESVQPEQSHEHRESPVKHLMKPPSDHGALHAIDEDEEDVLTQGVEEEIKYRKNYKRGNTAQEENMVLTKDDIKTLRKYYPEDNPEDGASVSGVVKEHMWKLTKIMAENVTTKTMLDVESKDKDRYEDTYTNFLMTVQDLEKFLGSFLNAVFLRKMKTQEGLNIITRFTPILHRPGIRTVITEKFVEVFNWYEGDLEVVHQLYEKYKDDPQMLRNAPRVAGAIHWSRQLLKRIEDPMKVFRENKAITQLKDFGRVCKVYNRLATALVTFESLWFSNWRSHIDHARDGLRATLFVHHPDTKEIVVNADERVLELIHEAKWLTRLGIEIPESARSVLQQEDRFKSYKGHLEFCLQEFHEVCVSIPQSLKDLFVSHIEAVQLNFQPGLSTLAWNSMNIDAFLHQIHTAIDKLRSLVEGVNSVVKHKVQGTIERIKNMFLFDYELAFSRAWPPEEFTKVIIESVHTKAEDLYDAVATIENGMHEIVTMLTNRKPPKFSILVNVLKAKAKWKRATTFLKTQQILNASLEQNSKKKRKEKSSAEIPIPAGYRSTKPGSTTPSSDGMDDKLVSDLLNHYCNQVYQAVLGTTIRSLITIAEASGCDGQVVRAMSAMSNNSDLDSAAHSPRPPSRTASVMSGDNNRPSTSLSVLSNMTWTTEKTNEVTYLQFNVHVKFSIPNIVIEPALDSVQDAVTRVSNEILEVSKGISWVAGDIGNTFHNSIVEDDNVEQILAQISTVVEDLQPIVKQHLFHFSLYDFLWKDDMHGNFFEFINNDPGMFAIKREVERLLRVELKVINIPQSLPVGPICLQTNPIKDALHGFAMAWKTKYASVLHEEAKKTLDSASLYRFNVRNRLELNVQTLDQLNSTLHLLEEVRDMENKVDEIYLPIENMYAKLREFELRLPRNEVEEVDQLREKWQDLLELAEQVRHDLLKDKRGAFEQELDKQVKTFVVEVIQFRNAFDAQGPAVPGIPPSEAVHRLNDFQQRYSLYAAKRQTLDSVSRLFGIICKPFPELDRTGEELDLLGQLYGLFQKFIRFDNIFRETLWAEVDLDSANREVESYWDECLALPSKLKDWDAYNEMKNSIQQYLDVFPLLHRLASKEIRNRHWLQVMSVTSTTFQLEANVFKLSHLLDIGLIKHKAEIEDICYCASKEQELEVKMRITEEEWTEQVLTFENYKKAGPIFLDKTVTEHLLEQLEDAQALLANMLTSKYIGPLREEAASWAEKLKEVGLVLEMWIEVQDLWQYLEAVFSNVATAKELPQEAKRFSRIDKGWVKMMKRAYDTRNVLQCCYGGEVPKGVVLRHIHEELEICFKSLMGYLDNKRRSFPRFYFVSDPVLLAMLSRPYDLESVRPHLRSVFSNVYDVKLEKTGALSETESSTAGTPTHRRSVTPGGRGTPRGMSPQFSSGYTPAPKIDKRLAVHDMDQESISKAFKDKGRRGKRGSAINPSLTSQQTVMLPSEMVIEETAIMDAIAVTSLEGEILTLVEQVNLIDGVEVWLQNLRESITLTLQEMLSNVCQEVNAGVTIDEWAYRYPAQVCRIGLLYLWTKECEQGVQDIKYDRKAMQNVSRKFQTTTSKLPTMLVRNQWRTLDEPMMPMHRLRLEGMITQSLHLRDSIDSMSNRKLREPTDFEWRRNFRCYLQEVNEQIEPLIYILDTKYQYGCEFYGAQSTIVPAPVTERCFLTMSQALSQFKGSCISGGTGVGKTETCKGLAQILGNFIAVFSCSPHMDASSLGKMLQGLSMDGSWGCFDEFQLINNAAICVLLDCVTAIFGAIKGRKEYCYFADGQEVSVKRNVAIFMTTNPSTAPPGFKMPEDAKALFRNVSMIMPDLSIVLKAKCTSLGLKGPSVLGTRLKIIADLAKDLLPPESHHYFSLHALNGVLVRATQKRKTMKEERTFERMEKKEETQLQSRSNSQASVQHPTIPSATNLTSPAPGSRNMPDTKASQRKAGTPNPLTPAAKLEHSIVGQALLEVIGPRLTGENLLMFKQIVKDVFSGLPDVPGTKNFSARSRTYDVEVAVEQTAQENSYIAHKSWVDKCMQLYAVSLIHHGIIVAGPPGSGKSTCIQTLVDALCVTPRGLSRHSHSSRATNPAETNHKLQRINPMVVDEEALMFGHLNQNHDWVDGIFTSAWRKANRNLSTTWLCLDSPLNPGWSDNFSSALDAGKVLHLKNGDKLFLSDNVKLLFETCDLGQASPAIVARSGIVYIDKEVLGWKPIAKAWLENRTQQEVHVLQRAFNKTVDAVSNYVINEAKPKIKLCEVGMFKTCLNLLSAMLADNIEIGGELHIERLYLFCLIWSFGGLIEKSAWKGFSDLVKTLSSALPDDDRDICVFDYYVDESGEWDPWVSRVPESVYTDNRDILGEVFVHTVDTIRTRVFMEFACASGQNVLLVGPPGSGKTTIVNEYLDAQDATIQISKRLVYSGSSTAKQLQQFIEANIYHRQGFVYGAKENKRLQLFIDDLNLPRPDEKKVQHCNELLRQLLDDKILCTLQKPFEWRTIEGLFIFATMSMSEYPSATNRLLDARLLRHFAVFNLPAPEGDGLKSIVQGVLESNLTQNDKQPLEQELHKSLVKASCKILSEVQNVMRPTPMHGRYHYLFTLKDLTICFQCLKRLPDEHRAEDIMVISLWKHEINRIMKDRLCRQADINWFEGTLDKTLEEVWPSIGEQLYEHFVTFPTDTRIYQRPVTSLSQKQVKVILQPVANLKDVHNCLNAHLTRYNEEFGNKQLDIMLSDHIISHIIRMHRVLSFHHGGNLLLIGAIGSHLALLCKLALHVADIEIHPVDSSKQNTFFDGLRSAVRLSGSEGKILTLLFTAKELHDDMYLDALNSLLVCGEYPHLLSNDELDGLLQAIAPALKREHPNMTGDPHKYFVSRLKSNLHIIVCLPPDHRLLKTATTHYPGLLSGCQINWMCDWHQESLLGEAGYYVSRHHLADSDDLSENITTCLANIHSFALRDCKQMPWAGILANEIPMVQVSLFEKRKGEQQLRHKNVKMPNLPYSKSILLEHIRDLHKNPAVHSKNEVFVGPTTYRMFMDSFKSIYSTKSQQRTETVNQLKRVLFTLDTTRQDGKIMKEAIKNIKIKFEQAKIRTAKLLKELTARATKLEKLKAKIGTATSLSAFLQLNEVSSDEEDEEELLQQEEYDNYDKAFDQLREANLKTRQVKAVEELVVATKQVEEAKKNLEYAKEQVIHWKSKVDRSTIERLRAFQNPPMLVGHVMEMVMTLIGKRGYGQGQKTDNKDTGKDDSSGRMMSASSSSTKLTATKKPTSTAKEMPDKFDRGKWKNIQLAMNDSIKFVDMLHNVPWEDGLTENTLHSVESYLAQGKGGTLGITGEGSMLENAAEKSFTASRGSPSPDNSKGITMAAAKFSSEDAATLVQYTIAIVEYTRLCGPLKTSTERQHELEREIEENERLKREKDNEERICMEKLKPQQSETEQGEAEEEDDLAEDDLPKIQEEVNQLQAQFDGAVVEKHSLEIELVSMNERLKAATEMLDSLKTQEQEWRQHVKENDSNEMLVANCIAGAAFLTYCGPMNTDTRKRMGEFFMYVCDHHGMPMPRKSLFRNLEMIDFLYEMLDVKNLEMLKLPMTRLMLENACFIMQQEQHSTFWPLMCDPTSRVVDWIKCYYHDKGILEVKYYELKSQLETCLADGIPLLVTDVNVSELVIDERFYNLMHERPRFADHKQPFKLMVGDHEVECDPKFRLYLHTTAEPHMIPEWLGAYTGVIFFHMTRQDIEEELLDRFMAQEKARLEDEKTALTNEKMENMKFLHKIEQQMRDLLSSDVRLMNDLQATKKLAELKKQFDETVESQVRIESNEQSISRAREGYRSVAARGAVCFDTRQYLREISPLYQTSFRQFLEIYDAAISHSERAAVKAVVERLTYSSYTTTSRALFERDRPIYGLLLAIEVEASLGNIGVGEREFLICPQFGNIIMTALGKASQDPKITQAKKPFDWMLDDQFQNVQILAIHYDWFGDMFDRMSKDGRETQWRTLCENDSPENCPLPDKMDDVYLPMQRLLLLRAVRPDRLIQATSLFVMSVLGKKYVGDSGVDLPLILRQSSPDIPILLMYSDESETAETLFSDFATRKQSRTRILTISDPVHDRLARKFLKKGMQEGLWVLLHNAHNAPHLLISIESIISEVESIDPQFRCWISVQADHKKVPARLLQTTVKVLVDSPKVMKDNMLRSFSWVDADILKQSSRPEWPALLHNICYLHGTLRLRARFGRAGWNNPDDFKKIGNNELFESLALAITEFRDNLTALGPDGLPIPRNTSWNGMRYMLAEIIYGSYITDPYDQQSLSAIIDYWISPNSTKKDFELARLKYKHPVAFFATHVRLTSLMQAIEGIPNHFLDVPEACHLHQSSETLLGDDQYVFSRLNKVFDSMPQTDNLSHKLFPRPPTPFEGPPLAQVSLQSNSPQVAYMGVFASASFAVKKMRKETELWEICHTTIPKVPKPFTKEFVAEKIKRLGGPTPFNIFIQKETEQLHALLTEVKITLNSIKTATELTVFGDQLPQSIIQAADDLYHSRIPQTWCHLSALTAPPQTYNLSLWLADLTNRVQHLEKILNWGREKTPAYWLGAFFNPRGLLALLKQDAHKHYANDRSGAIEQFVFQTEITARDKDHLRDPPQEGMFVYGIFIWGCAWEKTTGDLLDSPPRHGCTALPVVHITCHPVSEKPILQDPQKAADTFSCPVYHSRTASKNPVMEIDVRRENILATRWSLRGLSATIRPY